MQDNCARKVDDDFCLHTAQGHFSRALLRPDLPKPDDVIGPAQGKQAIKRFSVYRNNVIASLTEALMAAYPTIAALVGEEFFRAMAPAYISENPPQSAMLMTFGEDFGTFLDSFEPVEAVPYLGDVARLEEGWLKAYHAADQKPLDPRRLQEIDPDLLGEITFSFHAATQILKGTHPAYSIWAAHKETDIEAAMANIINQPEDILITRPEWDVTVVKLPAGGFAFIEALKAGSTLAEAADHAAEQDEQFDFAANLGGLLETGALVDIRLPNRQ